ncbi:hypothetical protein D3C81_1664290 [compost metagenome]
MLGRDQFRQRKLIALVHGWQRTIFITFTQCWHDFRPAVKAQDTTARFQTEIACAYGQCCRVVFRRVHLAGHELTPDQLIQLLGIGFHVFQGFGFDSHIRRTDRFVRFLRVFFARILDSAFRQVFLAEIIANVVAHHAYGVLAQVR